MRVNCLAQEHNTVSPRPLDPGTSALTMKPLRLHFRVYKKLRFLIQDWLKLSAVVYYIGGRAQTQIQCNQCSHASYAKMTPDAAHAKNEPKRRFSVAMHPTLKTSSYAGHAKNDCRR